MRVLRVQGHEQRVGVAMCPSGRDRSASASTRTRGAANTAQGAL